MTTMIETVIDGVEVKAPVHTSCKKVLSPEALQFVSVLHRQFNARREFLLRQRQVRQKKIEQGELPDFRPESKAIRENEWRISPVPESLHDRRVEITGPIDRKMIINALNSGANVFMADFEDSTSPTWKNIIEGQLNLHDAIRRQIDFELPDGKKYKLNENTAVLTVRPRGWHLNEKHVVVDGEPISASLFDFGVFVFNNGRQLASQGLGPFFYLPKLENRLEAALWNDVFIAAQDMLLIPRGTIKATVLIETITAAFEMDEIIYELREHMAGLNAGRWDYIFSIIKKLRKDEAFIMPDRSLVTMNVPFMKAYAELLVKTCHRRGAHAIGGMSAFIPGKDEAVNTKAFEQVKADKEREASQGYDGTWVAHPKLVGVAKEVFDQKLGSKGNQKDLIPEVNVAAADLLAVNSVERIITEEGFRKNISVALQYIESWLRGTGAVALYNLMEDAATAEISRAQLWQWLHHKNIYLEDGRPVTTELFQKLLAEEHRSIKELLKETTRDFKKIDQARDILNSLVLNEKFEDFLTNRAYNYLP